MRARLSDHVVRTGGQRLEPVKVDEPAGVDWLMIGLGILALLAVLGLIPLWQTVYRRYAAPPPAPASSLHFLDNELQLGTALQTNNKLELDDLAIVWYNDLSLGLPRARSDAKVRVAIGFALSNNRSLSLGVQLTGFKGKV